MNERPEEGPDGPEEERPTELLPGGAEGAGPAAGTDPEDDFEVSIRPPVRESLPPETPDRGERGRRLGFTVLAGSLLAGLILCGVYIALGAFDYRPGEEGDPCAASRKWGSADSLEAKAERFTVIAIDTAACRLRVGRGGLVVALASESSRQEFAASHGLEESDVNEALRQGLIEAVDQAERGGALEPVVAKRLKAGIGLLPARTMAWMIENAARLVGGDYNWLSPFGGVLGSLSGLVGGEPEKPADDRGADPGPDTGGGGAERSGSLTDQAKETARGIAESVLPDSVKKGIDTVRGATGLP